MPKKQSQEDKIKNKISKAGKNSNLLKIWYTDKDGRGTTRLTEPYEIRGGDYFGYCKTRNAIRRFKIDNIAQANISKKKYDPRWEIKTGGVMMDKSASEFLDELIAKEAGIFLEKNPRGYNSKEKQDEFIALGKRIDNGETLTPEERKKFDKLTMTAMPKVLRPEASLGVLGGLTGAAAGTFFAKKNILKPVGIGAGAGALAGAGLGYLAKKNRDKQIAKEAGLNAKDALIAAKILAKVFGVGAIAAGAGLAAKKSRDWADEIHEDMGYVDPRKPQKKASEVLDELFEKEAVNKANTVKVVLTNKEKAKKVAKNIAKVMGIGALTVGSGIAFNKSRDIIKDIENDGTKLINKAKNKDR